MTTFGAVRPYRAVEVLGPPSAGKSALAATLADQAAEARVVKRYRGVRCLPCLLRSWLAVAPMVLRDPMRGSLSRQQLTWIARLEASEGMLRLRGSPGAVVVFDQGPIYTLARLSDVAARTRAGGPLVRWRQAKIRQWAGLLDLIVVLDAPDAVLLHRIGARSKTHAFKDLPVDTAHAMLARHRAAATDVAGDLTDHGLRALVFDSSTSPVPEMASAVFAALDAEAQTRRTAQQR